MTTNVLRKFGIGAVARSTGLSHHVIRAWERRYGAVEPDREQAGRRRFTEADITRLKLLRDAVGAGHRIGAIAKLGDAQIRALLPKPTAYDAAAAVDGMMNAVQRLDAPRLESLLARAALALGPLGLCSLAISRLLDRIGNAWAEGELSPAEEHVATAAIKGTLLSLLRFGSDRVAGDMMVFSTLPHERHELGALMAAVCAQNAGARVLYLGPDLPVSEIAVAARRSTAKVIGLSAVMPVTGAQTATVRALKKELPRGAGIWAGGRGWSDRAAPPGVHRIGTLEELQQRVFRRPMTT